MAVAILMMNMHGAVCASDRDMTILRYKDGVPFAVMVDPNSKLPWEDIFDKFRVKHPNLPENYVETFKEYLEDYLPEYGDISAKDEKVFCIFYDKEELFAAAKRLDIQVRKNFVKIKIDKEHQISPDLSERIYIDWLGDLSNMKLLMGEVVGADNIISDKYKQVVETYTEYLISEVNDDKVKEHLKRANFTKKMRQFIDRFQMKQDINLVNAIDFNHIEDMVRMLESLIDTENHQYHLRNPKEPIGSTKEIAILTLAEGFKWIKHSLYGA